jgi:aminoglycoside phosphotransferase (APT) family kinase protein
MSAERPDPGAILAALGIDQVQAVAPVLGGQDTLVWWVRAAAGQYALRLFRPEQGEACRREARALALAAAGGVPVPTLVRVGEWQGRPVQLQEWREGVSLLAILRRQPWRAWRLGRAFGRLQARIHAVPAEAPELRARPWVALAGPGEATLQERLSALTAGRAALLHLDYHPLNVLGRAGRPVAVLDWVNAAAGDPRADLARTLTILRFAGTPRGFALPFEWTVRRLLEAGWRRGYADLAGRPTGMAPFYAWAGAMLLRDLAPRPGRAAGLSERGRRRVQRWTDMWKARAGIA